MPRKRGRRGNGGLTQRPNGKWQAQWSSTEGGRRVRRTATFALKGDAEWWLRQAKRGDAPDVALTVAEYLERWLAARRGLRASTKALYRSHVETHIVPALGRVGITALQPRHVERFVRDLEASTLKPSTIRGILTTLKSALAYGVKRRELPDSPALGIEPPHIDAEPVVAMTTEEAAALLDAVRGHWLEHLVRFLIGSGVRIGEAVALNQEDVQAGFVRVLRPKTVPRSVSVSEDGMAALAEAIRQAPRRGPREPVFFGAKGDRLTRAVASHALPRIVERAGLRRMTPHTLRHGTATLMVAAGVHMRVVAEQLGHANPSMTARVYAHVSPDSQRRAVGILDEAVRKR